MKEEIEILKDIRRLLIIINENTKSLVKLKDANQDKEVVGIVDNLNNERVATLIKCKQVEKSIPKGCGKYLGGMGIGYSVCGRLDNGGELLLCDKCKQVDKGEQK